MSEAVQLPNVINCVIFRKASAVIHRHFHLKQLLTCVMLSAAACWIPILHDSLLSPPVSKQSRIIQSQYR